MIRIISHPAIVANLQVGIKIPRFRVGKVLELEWNLNKKGN